MGSFGGCAPHPTPHPPIAAQWVPPSPAGGRGASGELTGAAGASSSVAAPPARTSPYFPHSCPERLTSPTVVAVIIEGWVSLVLGKGFFSAAAMACSTASFAIVTGWLTTVA